MRIKKLVSAFSALAITVTAIAGLAVTASAAETAFSQNFTANEAGSTDPADYGFIKISSYIESSSRFGSLPVFFRVAARTLPADTPKTTAAVHPIPAAVRSASRTIRSEETFWI